MRISDATYKQMNNLATLCFDANAIFDNLAYNLDYHYYNRIGKIVHLNIAHVMPEWADLITDQMLLLGGRPTRGAIGEYQEDIKDLKDIFYKILETMFNIRRNCSELIETADLNEDDEVRIFGEDFLKLINPFIKQSEEWLNAIETMSANDLNIHIDEYTNFITK